MFYNRQHVYVTNDGHHLGDVAKVLHKTICQFRNFPMQRAGLLNFVGNEIGRQQARISVEYILNYTFDGTHLRHYAQADIVWERLNLVSASLHYFSDALVVDAGDDGLDQFERFNPKVFVFVQQSVA